MDAGGLYGFPRLTSRSVAPTMITSVAFAVLFWQPFHTLLSDWWTVPDAGHGLLLGPAAAWFAWRAGSAPSSRPSPILGITILLVAIVLRYGSGLAAELFTMRVSMLMALVGLTTWSGVDT